MTGGGEGRGGVGLSHDDGSSASGRAGGAERGELRKCVGVCVWGGVGVGGVGPGAGGEGRGGAGRLRDGKEWVRTSEGGRGAGGRERDRASGLGDGWWRGGCMHARRLAAAATACTR